ncbi:MAG: hypothetical protein QOD86_827 [Miltoncostaeaceae bacterium]|nr:hypothetical protein [Miltoncostaeaceae bacterium]
MSALLAHLEHQVQSSRRMLGVVLAQGQAIRRQDVETVLARLGDVQIEMATQQRLEIQRGELLQSAALRLGTPADRLDLEQLLADAPPEEAAAARALSAELQGLVIEIGSVHDQNRVLMRQELTFLNHLMRVLSGAPQGGYSPAGWRAVPQTMNVVDARA